MTIDTPRRDLVNDIAGKQVDRRTLMKAGAWAAPVVAIAVATPAATASPFTLQVSNFRAVHGNGANWTYYIDVTNDSATTSANVSVQFYNGTTPTGTAKGTGTATIPKSTKSTVSAAVSLPVGQALPTNVYSSPSATGFTGTGASLPFIAVTTP